jgi:outer membrane receptor protein involved in Fe transport
MKTSPTKLLAFISALAAVPAAAHEAPDITPEGLAADAATPPGTAADRPVVLPEVLIVTDSRIEQQPRNVTQSVRAVTQETWEKYSTAPTNIADLMRLEPGQFVNPLSRNDANWGSAGGLGPKYSSYLLDGLPIDGFVDAMSLDPWAFDRVEEQRGPASVMYGNYLGMDFAGNAGALSGTSNFVLKACQPCIAASKAAISSVPRSCAFCAAETPLWSLMEGSAPLRRSLLTAPG